MDSIKTTTSHLANLQDVCHPAEWLASHGLDGTESAFVCDLDTDTVEVEGGGYVEWPGIYALLDAARDDD